MNLYEKINKIMSEVRSLQKDGAVNYGSTNYKYLSEAKTTDIFHKFFADNKIILLPVGVVEHKEGAITFGHYVYKMINCENPDEFILLEVDGQGHDSADKGSGKASSYAYKYLLWRTFAIPSNDDPDQTASDEIVAKEKAAADKAALERAEKMKAEREAKAVEKAQINADLKVKVNESQMLALVDAAGDTNSDIDALMKFFKLTDLGDMNVAQWKQAMHKYKLKLDKINPPDETPPPVADPPPKAGKKANIPKTKKEADAIKAEQARQLELDEAAAVANLEQQ